MNEKKFALERNQMVDLQIVARGVNDQRVLNTMRSVPRHEFVPPEHREFAYRDAPLPITKEQTISQPYIVALMTELLALEGGEKVLEVGTGSGYQAAILAYLADEVHTIERYAELARQAKKNLEKLGLDNVFIHIGDGSLGLPHEAPFDVIIVTAAAPSVPRELLKQLKENGRLVIPVGGKGSQFLECWRKIEGVEECESILPVAFVPLVGDQGWKEK